MISRQFSQKVTNRISIFAISAVLLSGALTAPSKAMDEVPTELEKVSSPIKTFPNALVTGENLQNEGTSKCIRKINRCWNKERTSDRIIHNIYTECTRGLECIWNFLWCRGCKNNRRLERDLRDI